MTEEQQETVNTEDINREKNLVKIHPKIEALGEATNAKLNSWADRLKRIFDKLP